MNWPTFPDVTDDREYDAEAANERADLEREERRDREAELIDEELALEEAHKYWAEHEGKEP
jgi:hypothetical protein